jgi:hypothetical protein
MWYQKQVNITLILLSSIGIIPKKAHSSTDLLWAIFGHSIKAFVFYVELIQQIACKTSVYTSIFNYY